MVTCKGLRITLSSEQKGAFEEPLKDWGRRTELAEETLTLEGETTKTTSIVVAMDQLETGTRASHNTRVQGDSIRLNTIAQANSYPRRMTEAGKTKRHTHKTRIWE